MPRLFILLLVGVLLIGCEAQATPIANLATPTATSVPSPAPVETLRYGIASNIVPYIGDLEREYDIVDTVSALAEYDLIVSYGVLDGWQQSPQAHRVSLIINPNLAPLDTPVIRDLIPAVIDRQAIVDSLNMNGAQQTIAQSEQVPSAEIRTILANNGLPDGFLMTLATEQVPAIEILASQFSVLSLDLRFIPLRESGISETHAHLTLFLWANESERLDRIAQVDNAIVLDLWTMPISYLASEGVAVDFTADGIPFPTE